MTVYGVIVLTLMAGAFVWWVGFDMGRDVAYWEHEDQKRHNDGQADG